MNGLHSPRLDCVVNFCTYAMESLNRNNLLPEQTLSNAERLHAVLSLKLTRKRQHLLQQRLGGVLLDGL